MAQETIIHQHLPYAEAGKHQHPSLAADRRARQAADNQLNEFYHPDRYYSEKSERMEEIRQEPRSMCE